MVDKAALVQTKQYREAATQWLEALKRKENVSVVFFPKTDRLIRFQQFLQDSVFMKSILGKEARFFFQILDFDTLNIEDKNDMENRIAEQMNFSRLTSRKLNFSQWLLYLRRHNVTLVLVLPRAEKYFSEPGSRIFSYLSAMIDTYDPFVISLCFFEADITHPYYSKLIPQSTRLYQNICYYPLYSPDDTRAFVQYLGKIWKKRIPAKLEQTVVELCGGHFWLVKEAVRKIVAESPDPFTQEGMQFRLRTIYEYLSPVEQATLSKLMLGKKNIEQSEKESLRYFQKMNFIDVRNRCKIQLFKDFIENHFERHGEFSIQQNKIFLNNVPIGRIFSRQEQRVFRLFLEHKDEIISREMIANSMWPTRTEEQYSDWAIDQLIARLRKRLSELSLSPKLLQAIRGKGYLFRLS